WPGSVGRQGATAADEGGDVGRSRRTLRAHNRRTRPRCHIRWRKTWDVVMGPSRQHERRTELLTTIATLGGYCRRVTSALPDGRRRELLRLATAWRGVFLGDAKHSETPYNLATKARLYRYLMWLSPLAPTWRCLLALCYSTVESATTWERAMTCLTREAGL